MFFAGKSNEELFEVGEILCKIVLTTFVTIAYYHASYYNKKSIEKSFSKTLAEFCFCVYNVECCSLTAMKREVADTPGRIAMARVWEIFVENVY